MASNQNSSRNGPEQRFNAAVAKQKAGNLSGAVEDYLGLLGEFPNHPQVMSLCALAQAELGQADAAIRLLERCVAVTPDFADAWNNLGVLRQRTGDYQAAADAFQRVRGLVPESALGHANLGNVYQLMDQYADAVSAYKQGLKHAPQDAGMWSNYARALLFEGQWERAIDATDRTLALSPGHTGALALRSDALLQLGRTDEWSDLVDFERLIEKAELSPPDHYADLAAFNDALCNHCKNHPSLVYEPAENSTVNGYHTGNLSLDDDQGPIGELLEIITAAVKEYQAARPGDPAHPFLAQRPGRWNYDIWSVVMGRQGHQAAHIHRSGWLSGCYYPKVPGSISAKDKNQEGWIEFGFPQDLPAAKAEPVLRAYPPTEGMIVLFPSYFYHRTVPYNSDDERISIAFDILPLQ